MKKRTKVILAVVAITPLVAVTLMFVTVIHWRHIGASSLIRCRSEMISEIERKHGEQAWVAVKDSTAGIGNSGDSENQPADPWLTDHLILMKNGEKLFYSYRCSKEDRGKDKLLPGLLGYDPFIGRGEDSKWYYTSYHFCIGMLVLGIDGQPESLAAFADEYCLREFDGRAENCAAKTFPSRD